jgi:hypothetical protein
MAGAVVALVADSIVVRVGVPAALDGLGWAAIAEVAHSIPVAVLLAGILLALAVVGARLRLTGATGGRLWLLLARIRQAIPVGVGEGHGGRCSGGRRGLGGGWGQREQEDGGQGERSGAHQRQSSKTWGSLQSCE